MRPQCKDIDVVLVGLRDDLAVLLPDDVVIRTVPLLIVTSYHHDLTMMGLLPCHR
jgi:hypothetical protein